MPREARNQPKEHTPGVGTQLLFPLRCGQKEEKQNKAAKCLLCAMLVSYSHWDFLEQGF